MGNKDRFEAEVLSLRPWLVEHAQRYCRGDRQRAEDLVQDALVRAWGAWERFESSSEERARDVRAWMSRIVTNVFLGDYKRSCVRRDTADKYAKEPEASEHAVQNHEGYSDEVEAALAKVDPHMRSAFVLVSVEGLSYGEAAEVLGCSVGTISSGVYRARRQLASLLGGARVDPASTEAPKSPEQNARGVDRVVSGLDDAALGG